MSLVVQTPFTGLSAKAYEHPADRAATAALQRIPLLDAFVRKLAEFSYERALVQQLRANAVQAGDTQLPELWHGHVEAYRQLDIERVPDLYVRQSPAVNGMTVGADRPVVVLDSELVRLLDAGELRVVAAHEAGHVLSEHVLYRTVLAVLLELGLPHLPVLGDVALRAITLALLEWARAAELSADRAAALVVRDPLLVCRTLATIAGGVPGLNVDAFLRQAEEYAAWDDLFDKRLRFLTEVRRTHPYAVKRVSELTRWVREGEYDRIIAGEYVRRGEEPPPSAEFERAVQHYQQRFVETVESTGIALTALTQRMQEWLRSVRDTVVGGEGARAEEETPPAAKPKPRKRRPAG